MIAREISDGGDHEAVAQLRLTLAGNVKSSAAHQIFEPETAEAMGAAFDSAWQSLLMQGSPLTLDAGWAREQLALRIIDVTRHGITDAAQLREDALTHLADIAARRCSLG